MEIQEWLHNGADYAQGVKIYKSLPGHSKLLLRQFALRENPLRKEKLMYELKKFINHQPELQKISATPAPIVEDPRKEAVTETIIAAETQTAPLFHELPTELRPVLLEANTLFRENCYLKAELNEVAIDDEERALAIQVKIDRNFKANAMCWEKIEYWRTHKVLPKTIATQDIANYSMDKLIKELQLLNSSVSRMEKRLKQNKEALKVVENLREEQKIQRKIAKQEADIIKKREQILIIKTTIDVKTSSI